ncbi:MAG: hypothetical protein IKP06_01095 [Elusimicrobiaceae bacterium]|nr:hypothetical protein [Elusimicrobiaceae bacterium]
MLNKYAPHQWISWRGLRFIALVVFYIAFVVGIYALVRWIGTFVHPSATALLTRRLYLAAWLQATFFCLVSGSFAHALKALQIITQQKYPKK